LKNRANRLEELEFLLKLILMKLEKIEQLLSSLDSEDVESIKIANRLILAFSMPALKAIEAAMKIRSLIGKRTLDDISRTILEVLAVKDGISISELTRRIREVRGRASRRIISERLKLLEKEGLIVVERRGSRAIIRLSEDHGGDAN